MALDNTVTLGPHRLQLLPGPQRQSYARAQVEVKERLARQHGVTRVYLLMETAADFFARFGFRPIPRDQVAAAVQHSVEFTTACPETALAMVLDVLA